MCAPTKDVVKMLVCIVETKDEMGMFFKCPDLTKPTTITPILTTPPDLSGLFYVCIVFNSSSFLLLIGVYLYYSLSLSLSLSLYLSLSLALSLYLSLYLSIYLSFHHFQNVALDYQKYLHQEKTTLFPTRPFPGSRPD